MLAFALSPDSMQIISAIIVATVSIAAGFIAARHTEKYRDQSENEELNITGKSRLMF